MLSAPIEDFSLKIYDKPLVSIHLTIKLFMGEEESKNDNTLAAVELETSISAGGHLRSGQTSAHLTPTQ